jgi:ATP-dependent Lon protease
MEELMTDPKQPAVPDPEAIADILPILPLSDTILYPKMVLPLMVMEELATRVIDDAMGGSRTIGLLAARQADKGHGPSYPRTADLAAVGTAGLILKMAKGRENRTQLLVQGLKRFKVRAFVEGKPYHQARIVTIDESEDKDNEIEAMMLNLVSQFTRIVELSPGMPQEMADMARSITEAGTLADMVVSTINSSMEEKQRILETTDVRERIKDATRITNRQLGIIELGNKIQQQVKGDLDQRQREFYLREQLKAIKEELGEKDEETVEIDEYRSKIEAAALPDEARKEADRELKRLSKMHPSSAEYTVTSTYLDWITALPWTKHTEDNLDIAKARKILDEDHYGLEKPKKRIIEYLAVRKLKPDSKGPILCFAGPPGTGKTSLGQSIARSLGRKFVRISLGGVRDEAEIRGHRRTYVGALPGRIIQGLRRAESNNPVFMLDEIDKVGSDFRGDPSAALLEVLDPQQNFSFSDHYLDVPFDLSRVMFITTANILDTIPPPLRDRMEVLQLLGYTEAEKINIANRFLIPRQRSENGLKASQIGFSRGAIRRIIGDYTREAGLRNLEREIANICRGVASRIAAGEIKKATVKIADVPVYLGAARFSAESKARTLIPGVATGLAWTPVGGELLFIEATAMKGKERLTLTGQLGDVMKESAQAALTFIRTHATRLGLADNFFENTDIHIHIPAGAIPKDGPSAGVTLLTALVSFLTGRKVKKDLAMTGEITLRGQVLPVGGIKEKMLAAHRAGIRTVILPSENRKDVDELPENVRRQIQFHFVDRMLDVVKLALEK